MVKDLKTSNTRFKIVVTVLSRTDAAWIVEATSSLVGIYFAALSLLKGFLSKREYSYKEYINDQAIE